MMHTAKISVTKTLFVLPVAMFLLTSCGDGSKSLLSDGIKNYPVTYSFLDVDVNTRLSDSLEKKLDRILGDHATETRNTIGIAISNEEFMQEYFSYLYGLNRKLNSSSGEIITPETGKNSKVLTRERVEHNTVKLAYRYAVKKNMPFTYVEFLFSGFDSTPLLIRFRFRTDELNIVNTLKHKYGSPREIPWKEENGKSLFWEKGRDMLVLSFVPDQFGKPAYEVIICFSKRVEDLLQAERLDREKKHRKKPESGQNVF